MSSQTVNGLIGELRRTLDNKLIGVGYHRDTDWDALYMRRDFEETHGPDQREAIAREMILSGLAKQVQETVWGFGDLRFTMAEYDDAIVLHFPFSEREGLAVGIDPTGRQQLEIVTGICREYQSRFGSPPGSEQSA